MATTKFEIVHTIAKDKRTGAPIVDTIVRDPETQEPIGKVSHMKVTGGPIEGFSAVVEFGPPPPPPAPEGAQGASGADQGAATTTKDTGAKGVQTGAATPLAGGK